MPVAINNGTDMIATIKDIRPSPMWRGTRPSHSITRVQAYSRFHGKMLECCPLSTGSSSSLAPGDIAAAIKKRLADLVLVRRRQLGMGPV